MSVSIRETFTGTWVYTKNARVNVGIDNIKFMINFQLQFKHLSNQNFHRFETICSSIYMYIIYYCIKIYEQHFKLNTIHISEKDGCLHSVLSN